jgi:DNA-binding transcriptional LysR family regulator
VRELAGLQQGKVRLGATPSLSTALVPRALRRYPDRYPGIRLMVQEGGSRDLVSTLAQGALDLALIILPLHANDPALHTIPLFNEPLVVAVPPGHAFGDRFREGYDLRAVTLAACRRAGFEPVFAVEGGEMDAVLEMVQAGLGPSVIPTMIAAGMPNLRVLPLSRPRLTRTVAVAHRRDVHLPRTAHEFVQVLVELLHEQAASGHLGPTIKLLDGAAGTTTAT